MLSDLSKQLYEKYLGSEQKFQRMFLNNCFGFFCFQISLEKDESIFPKIPEARQKEQKFPRRKVCFSSREGKKILLIYRTHKGKYEKEPLHRRERKKNKFLSFSRQAQNLLFINFIPKWKLKWFIFWFLFDTENMACLELNHKCLLPSAICVQRFGNWKVLQLIPLIALCCVLQRNRKPSHPSRHVVRAVVNRSWAAKKFKREFLNFWVFVFFLSGWLKKKKEKERKRKRIRTMEKNKKRRDFFYFVLFSTLSLLLFLLITTLVSTAQHPPLLCNRWFKVFVD